MDILFTFTGFHDPYSKGLVGEEEQPGPILSLIAAKSFDRIFLFSTPNTEKNTSGTKEFLRLLYPAIEVERVDLPIYDPTDYSAILKELRENVHRVCVEIPNANYFIAAASGTPQMHACWILLAASGEIPARILHIRPPRFVSKDMPLVSEVDLTTSDFPTVRPNIFNIHIEDSPPDFNTTVQQLGIVGDHESTRKTLEMGAMLAPSDVPVLITGETGTGKELFARFIHHLSERPKNKFVPLNCAALPEELVESLLFGHRRGAFTGAINDQKGKFDSADGGTLFLDELGELPLGTQAKLLRVLQDGMIEPLGGREAHKVDVRIIAATNKSLEEAIKQKTFRDDLFFRLSVGQIHLPPLRERRSDIPKIALYILDRVNQGLRKQKRLSQTALARLQSHNWSGNVRDLQNVIERSILLTRKEILEADDLLISEPIEQADPFSLLPEVREGFIIEDYLDSVRHQLFLRALELANNNQSKAAKLLGLSPQAVHKFLRKT